MESILPQLLAFPPHPPPVVPLTEGEYDKSMKSLVRLLNGISGSKLKSGISTGDDLLDILDPSRNTLVYLYVLLAHLGNESGIDPASPLWSKSCDFVENMDPVQVRYAGAEWRHLLGVMAWGAGVAGKHAAAIGPLRTALLRLDPTSSTFTLLHLTFVRLCLRARRYEEALPILDKGVWHYPSPTEKQSHLPKLCAQHATSATYITIASGLTDKLEYKEPLLYHLFGAMCYLAVKNLDRASLFLEIVMMWPAANTASMIQVEAYKKWVLVNLLMNGKGSSMPRGTNPYAAKHYRALGKPYEVLDIAFRDPNPSRLEREIEHGQGIWKNDGNTGLVLQVHSAHQRFAIQSLSKIYASLPLSLIVNLAFPPDQSVPAARAYIEHLIATDQLSASLYHSSAKNDTFLRFQAPGSTDLSEGELERKRLEEILRQKQRTEMLSAHMAETRRKMELSKEYIEMERKARKNAAAAKEEGKNGVGAAPPTTFPIQGLGAVDQDTLMEM